MAPVDVAWLRMEHPTNLMVVTALLSFERAPRFDKLEEIIERRLLVFDRFRQRVVERGLLRRRARWERDPYFDLSSHLRRIALPPPGDEATLREVVSDLVSTPLDPSKPLWQAHLIEDYGGGCALLIRIHHCIADGMGLLRVLISLTDGDGRSGDAGERPRARLGALARSLASAAGATVGLGKRLLRHPRRGVEMARLGADSALAASHLLLRPPDPPTALRGALGVPKRAAWSEALPLADVKAAGRATGSTVNDVFLAALTGALRRYLVARGDAVEGLDIHAAVPVNLRPPDESGRLGNQFGLVFASLPVGIEDPLERLFAVRRRMEELKQGPEAGVALKILRTLGSTPAQIQKALVEYVGAKTSAVVTNVRGPDRTVRLAGAPVRSIMFWVPMTGRVGLGVSILSYAGQVRLGVVSDSGLLPDPERIAEGFQQEFESYRELARAPGDATLVTA